MKNRNSFLSISLLSVLTCLLFCSTSFAGWELLQNSPTTNDLHSVYFVNDYTGWIAGYNNTIFKTTNGGESWIQQTSPISSNFECITFVNANTGWACGSGGTVIKTTNGGVNWFTQTFTASKFNSMDFVDANTGYIAGEFGTIRKTTNGGSIWSALVSGVGQELHEIRYYYSDIVFAVGDNAIILRSSNGGLDWIKKSGPGIGSQIFYSLGHDGFSYSRSMIATGTLTKYSDNDGETWTISQYFPIEPIYSLSAKFFRAIYGVGSNGYSGQIEYYGNIVQTLSPTSENLYGVYYSSNNNTAWSVGANGTIIKYSTNWTYIPQNYNTSYAAYFISQNTGWSIIDEDQIIKTTNGGYNWISQDSSALSIKSIYFINSNSGWAAGRSNHIIKTTDGGNNWYNLSSSESGNWYSVDFIDNLTGWICGSEGKIIKTINGGNSWNTFPASINDTLRNIVFINENTGWVCGDSGKIIKTANGGQNWSLQNSGTTQDIYEIKMLDATTGWFICHDKNNFTGSSGIFKTTSGGSNWFQQKSFYGWIKDIDFIDKDIGYACGQIIYNAGSVILKTTDGGNYWEVDEVVKPNLSTSIQFIVENNIAFGFIFGSDFLSTSFEYLGGEPVGNSGNYPGWVGLNSGTSQHIGGVDYISPFIAFAVGMRDPPGTGTGTILRTINGGQSWVRQASGVNAEFNAVSFSDVNNGIAVGYPSFIVHTTNSGTNWVQQTSPTNQTLIDVDMIDTSHAFICGDQVILYTSNGGTNWQIQNTPLGYVFADIDFINQTTATTVSSSGLILRTTNTGTYWTIQYSGVLDQIRSIDFIDVNNGIAITQFGPSLRTTNGGVNWLLSDTLGYTQGVCYIDSNNAFAAGYEGLIYRTTNGGINWISQNANSTENFLSINFTDANNGIIVGQNGTILRTSNAGVISGTNTSYNRNGLNLPINDLQNTNDSINVNITDKSTVPIITRVYLKIDTVLHTNDGDLEFYLEHNGITDTLIYQNGGSGDNFLGTFLNDATNFPLVSGTAPFRGSYKSYRPLARFNGQNPNGFWKLRIYDRAAGNTGTLEAWSLNITYTQVIGITGNQNTPSEYKLFQNYPNPFNPVTKIKFSLPNGNGRDFAVKLKIYDILGREVTTLINQQMKPGNYIAEWNAGNYASGVYFYRLETGDFAETRKMVLLK
jgi:photosystem II stability/assembly factor-like uncharacterized protein